MEVLGSGFCVLRLLAADKPDQQRTTFRSRADPDFVFESDILRDDDRVPCHLDLLLPRREPHDAQGDRLRRAADRFGEPVARVSVLARFMVGRDSAPAPCPDRHPWPVPFIATGKTNFDLIRPWCPSIG